MSAFGEKLRELRQIRGMTQAQLADRLQLSSSTVGMYEQGRREPDNATLKKICSELSVSIDYILGLEKESFRKRKEIDEVIDEFTQLLEGQQGLMFNGEPISAEDREKIITAIRVAAAVAVSESQRVKKNN